MKKTNRIQSIIEEFKQATYKSTTTLIKLLVFTIMQTNFHLEIRIILLRCYRYIRKQTYEDCAKLLNISTEEYIASERGNNIHLIEKHKDTMFKSLNIPIESLILI